MAPDAALPAGGAPRDRTPARGQRAAGRPDQRAGSVGIYEIDLAGSCRYVNQRWCELAGMSADAAMGDGWRAVVHPDGAMYGAKRAGRPAASAAPGARVCRRRVTACAALTGPVLWRLEETGALVEAVFLGAPGAGVLILDTELRVFRTEGDAGLALIGVDLSSRAAADACWADSRAHRSVGRRLDVSATVLETGRDIGDVTTELEHSDGATA